MSRDRTPCLVFGKPCGTLRDLTFEVDIALQFDRNRSAFRPDIELLLRQDDTGGHPFLVDMDRLPGGARDERNVPLTGLRLRVHPHFKAHLIRRHPPCLERNDPLRRGLRDRVAELRIMTHLNFDRSPFRRNFHLGRGQEKGILLLLRHDNRPAILSANQRNRTVPVHIGIVRRNGDFQLRIDRGAARWRERAPVHGCA